ncbi:MAG: GTPase HflX [Firmicutes bacterium]|nr:GTPase HflX [Bacillota bacterium]
MIKGNIIGIKNSDLSELENLLKISNKALFIDRQIAEVLIKHTLKYKREFLVLIARNGKTLDIYAGDTRSAVMETPAQKKLKLSGVRCIHTHPLANAALSEADIATLKNAMLDAMCAVAVTQDGVQGIQCGFYIGNNLEKLNYKSFDDFNDDTALRLINESEKALEVQTHYQNTANFERAALVFVFKDENKSDYVIGELKELAKTAGAEVAGVFTQRLKQIDSRLLAGEGKLAEVKQFAQENSVNLVIFNNELSGIQIKNLEDFLGVKVIDRSSLILDIFAGRATSNEGKLQVELAQLKYNLPKLLGFGAQMDKMRSGIGMRGPGEKKLEVDRRNIKDKIWELQNKIKKLSQERDLRRQKRKKSYIKTVALVGYTNAGKSTVLNALAKSAEYADDKLFATLDPVTRKVHAAHGKSFLLTDTVGFIDKLPHSFIDAFKSTLEEAVHGDMLLHIVDVSNEHMHAQTQVVLNVLHELGLDGKNILTVYNKTDKLHGKEIPDFNNAPAQSIFISAKNPADIERLRTFIAVQLDEM